MNLMSVKNAWNMQDPKMKQGLIETLDKFLCKVEIRDTF
jgi:hypothetical protein